MVACIAGLTFIKSPRSLALVLRSLAGWLAGWPAQPVSRQPVARESGRETCVVPGKEGENKQNTLRNVVRNVSLKGFESDPDS